MKRIDLWKLSLRNVLSSPVRSVLTVLGFAIGVAAILAVLTLGEAGKKQVESEMTRLGIDKVWIAASEENGLIRGTGKWFFQNTGIPAREFIYLTAPLRIKGRTEAAVTIVGCEQEYLNTMQLRAGRMLLPVEWNADCCSVFIGEKLAEQLQICVGDYVSIAGGRFEVCGILAQHESASRVPLETAAVLPVDALCRFTGGSIHEIQLSIAENLTLNSVKKLARNVFSSQNMNINIVTMEVQMNAASSVIETFVNVLKWVAFVCILAGGIGVMNVLLINIRERRREIGIMKSMGAASSLICTLFLLEALVYAAIGGSMGIVLGIILIKIAGTCIDLTAAASIGDCTAVFACALCIGILFGVLPAFRASRLKCVDALRQE